MASDYSFDSQLQRPAAIKVIDERHSGETSYAARFVREARAMASWRHPNIPQIYQSGVENGVYFYAMEYIHGMDLEDLLRQSVQKGELLSYGDVLLYGKAIAEALDFAHLKGVIHRDVKPSNVLIAMDGRIMLTDFGLILEVDKSTRGEVFGSPLYIAPEQARSSADAVPQSDLFSLGVLLYEMLVGRLPFEDNSPASLAIKHITLEPPAPCQLNPDLSPEVEAVLLMALRKKPQERYQTGKELMAALEQTIGAQSGGSRSLPSNLFPPVTLPFLPVEPQVHAQSTDLELGSGLDQPANADPLPHPAVIHIPDAVILGEKKRSDVPFLKKRYIFAAILALITPATLCVFLLGVSWLFGKLDGIQPGSSVQPYPATSMTPGAATSSAIKAATQAGLTPSPAPVRLYLSLSSQKTDIFLVINQGKVGVPLAQLRFESPNSKFTADGWGIDILASGQCVSIVKKEGHLAPQPGAECNLVGKQLTLSDPNKFWDQPFEIYFQNVLITSCDFERGPCVFQFSEK
jgi:serine/threonine protein kinase